MQPTTLFEKQSIATQFLSDKAALNVQLYDAFFQHYESIFCKSSKHSFFVGIDKPAFTTHDDVTSAFAKLISNPSQTREEFSRTLPAGVSDESKNDGIRAVVRAALMLDCASKQNLPEGYRVKDFKPRSWQTHQSFADFVESCFPVPTHTPAERMQIQDAQAKRTKLKAWKIKERNNVKFRPTDNLAEHLLFDKEGRIVKVFRHVGFLKAQLQHSEGEPINAGFGTSLKLYVQSTQPHSEANLLTHVAVDACRRSYF